MFWGEGGVVGEAEEANVRNVGVEECEKGLWEIWGGGGK